MILSCVVVFDGRVIRGVYDDTPVVARILREI